VCSAEPKVIRGNLRISKNEASQEPEKKRNAQPSTASTATTVVKLAVVHCRRKRQQQQHHQRTNGSTNMKMCTSPDNLDLFNLSTVFEVCDDGRGNLAISKLLEKKIEPFL
jgi:hypothetical protein